MNNSKNHKRDIKICTVHLSVMKDIPVCEHCVAGVYQDECMAVSSKSYFPRCPLRQQREIYVLEVD